MNRRIKMKKLKQENERLRALLDQVTAPGLSVIFEHSYTAEEFGEATKNMLMRSIMDL